MSKLTIIILFLYFCCTLNSQIYNDVYKNGFSKTFDNLSTLNDYFFVCEVELFETVYYGIKFTAQNTDIIPSIKGYGFYVYTKNSKGYSSWMISPINIRRINNEFAIYFEETLTINKYLGISVIYNAYISHLLLNIETNTKFNLTNDKIYSRNLTAVIPYSFFFNIEGHNHFDIYINTRYETNNPFTILQITENLNDKKKISTNKTIEVKFYKNFEKYEMLTSYNITNRIDEINNITLLISPDYDIYDFQIRVKGSFMEDPIPSKTILGLSVIVFSFIVVGAVILIAAIIIIIIVIIKKRNKPSNESNKIEELPLVTISNN